YVQGKGLLQIQKDDEDKDANNQSIGLKATGAGHLVVGNYDAANPAALERSLMQVEGKTSMGSGTIEVTPLARFFTSTGSNDTNFNNSDTILASLADTEALTVAITQELMADESWGKKSSNVKDVKGTGDTLAATFHQTDDEIGELVIHAGGSVVLNGKTTTVGKISNPELLTEKKPGVLIMNQNTLTINKADSQIGVLAVNKIKEQGTNTIYTCTDQAHAYILTVGQLATSNLTFEPIYEKDADGKDTTTVIGYKQVATRGFTLQLGDENPGLDLTTLGKYTSNPNNNPNSPYSDQKYTKLVVANRGTLTKGMYINNYNNKSEITMAKGLAIEQSDTYEQENPEVNNYGKITVGADDTGNSINLQIGIMNNASRYSQITVGGTTIIQNDTTENSAEKPTIKNEGVMNLANKVSVTGGIMTNGNKSSTYGYLEKDGTYMTAKTGTDKGKEYLEDGDYYEPTKPGLMPTVNVTDNAVFQKAELTNYGRFIETKDIEIGTTDLLQEGQETKINNASKISEMNVLGTTTVVANSDKKTNSTIANEGTLNLNNVVIKNGSLSNGNETLEHLLPDADKHYTWDKTQNSGQGGYVLVDEADANNQYTVTLSSLETNMLGIPTGNVQLYTQTLSYTDPDSTLMLEPYHMSQLELYTAIQFINYDAPKAVVKGKVTVNDGELKNYGVFHVEGETTVTGGTLEHNGPLMLVDDTFTMTGGIVNLNNGITLVKQKMTLGDAAAETEVQNVVGNVKVGGHAIVEMLDGSDIYDGKLENFGKVIVDDQKDDMVSTVNIKGIEGADERYLPVVDNHDNTDVTRVWHGADYMLTGIVTNPVTPYNPANPLKGVDGVKKDTTHGGAYYVTDGTKPDGTAVSAVQNFTLAQNESVNNPLLSLKGKAGVINALVADVGLDGNETGSYTMYALDGNTLLGAMLSSGSITVKYVAEHRNDVGPVGDEIRALIAGMTANVTADVEKHIKYETGKALGLSEAMCEALELPYTDTSTLVLSDVGGFTPNMVTEQVVLENGIFNNDGVVRVEQLVMKGANSNVTNNGIISVGHATIYDGLMNSTGTIVLDGGLDMRGGTLHFEKGAIGFTVNALLDGGLKVSGKNTNLYINASSLMSDDLLKLIDADHISYVGTDAVGQYDETKRVDIYEYVTNIGGQYVYQYKAVKGEGGTVELGDDCSSVSGGTTGLETLGLGQTGWRKLGFAREVMGTTITSYADLINGTVKGNEATIHIDFAEIARKMVYNHDGEIDPESGYHMGGSDKDMYATISGDAANKIVRDDYEYVDGTYYYNYTAMKTIQNMIFNGQGDYGYIVLENAELKLGKNELLVIRKQEDTVDGIDADTGKYKYIYGTKDLEYEDGMALVYRSAVEEEADAATGEYPNDTAHLFIRTTENGHPSYGASEDKMDSSGRNTAVAVEGENLKGLQFGKEGEGADAIYGGTLVAANLAFVMPQSGLTLNINNGDVTIYGKTRTSEMGLILGLNDYTQAAVKMAEENVPDINIKSQGTLTLGYEGATAIQGGKINNITVAPVDGTIYETNPAIHNLSIRGNANKNLMLDSDGNYVTHFAAENLDSKGRVLVHDAQFDVPVIVQDAETGKTNSLLQIDGGKVVSKTVDIKGGNLTITESGQLLQTGRIETQNQGITFGTTDKDATAVLASNSGVIDSDIMTINNAVLDSNGMISINVGGSLTLAMDEANLTNRGMLTLKTPVGGVGSDAVMQVDGGTVDNQGSIDGNKILVSDGVIKNTGIVSQNFVPVYGPDPDTGTQTVIGYTNETTETISMTGGSVINSGEIWVKNLSVGTTNAENKTASFLTGKQAVGASEQTGYLYADKIIVDKQGTLQNIDINNPVNLENTTNQDKQGGYIYADRIESSGEIINNGFLKKHGANPDAKDEDNHLSLYLNDGHFVNSNRGLVLANVITGKDALATLTNSGELEAIGNVTLGTNGMLNSGTVRFEGNKNIIDGTYRQTDGITTLGKEAETNTVKLDVDVLQIEKGQFTNKGVVNIITKDEESVSFAVAPNETANNVAKLSNGTMNITKAEATGKLTLKSVSSEMFIDKNNTVDFAVLNVAGGVIDNDGTLKITAGDVGTERNNIVIMNSGFVELRDNNKNETGAANSYTQTLKNIINGGEIKLIRTESETDVATVVTCAANLVNNKLVDLNDNVLKITCCDLTVAIGSEEKDTGILEIAGGGYDTYGSPHIDTVKAQKDIYTKIVIDGKTTDDSSGDLTVAANHLHKDVENNGKLHLQGKGEFALDITNGENKKGFLDISGEVISTGQIRQNMLQIQNASKFTADVGKLTIEDEDTP
ncbi:MAG: hypothetical protein KBS60_00780, partial [Phascolarctobacterium sp.]|nr:hypothetical protein [Candidatus Phascolarctobacterium caballi]